MKFEHTYIEGLIEKFFEGKTSNKEEKVLWSYFSGEHIPDHLMQHKAFFLYYSHGFMTEVTGVKQSLTKHRMKGGRIRMMVMGISAVVAVLIFALVFFFFESPGERFDSYNGSYMLVDGEKVYDIELIRQQEGEIREMSASRDKEYQEIYVQSVSRKNELRNIMMVTYK